MAVSPRWQQADVVEGFRASPPNAVLMEHAQRVLERHPGARVLDVGCGAGRNAVPLAHLGCHVTGTDLSWPMLVAARERSAAEGTGVALVHAPMERLPFAGNQFDLVIAHGVWNLARSAQQLRAAVAEAARVARTGTELFLFTFSRTTIAPTDAPVAGETFVFTQFNGEPQCFLTEAEVLAELAQAGFVRGTRGPLTEYNRPTGTRLVSAGPPVLFEGTFVRQG